VRRAASPIQSLDDPSANAARRRVVRTDAAVLYLTGRSTALEAFGTSRLPPTRLLVGS
jgi:hypothetical protein